jgi:hypothetical protein
MGIMGDNSHLNIGYSVDNQASGLYSKVIVEDSKQNVVFDETRRWFALVDFHLHYLGTLDWKRQRTGCLLVNLPDIVCCAEARDLPRKCLRSPLAFVSDKRLVIFQR